MTWSFFLPKSNSKSVYSFLRSIAGSSSSSSSFNFPKCSSPRESGMVFADYLRSHFFVSQPKALHSRATGYLSKLCRATCPEESCLSFCSSFSHTEFLVAASNLSSSTATGPNKVAYHAKASSSLWHGFSSLHFHFFMDFAFFSFHLEDIFYYSYPQDGKAS